MRKGVRRKRKDSEPIFARIMGCENNMLRSRAKDWCRKRHQEVHHRWDDAKKERMTKVIRSFLAAAQGFEPRK